MTLSGLAFESLTISPTFDKTKTSYTGTALTGTDEITATLTDSKSKLKLTFNGDVIESGDEISWVDGTNTIKATVTNIHGKTNTYTVTVTYDMPEAKLTALTIGALTLDPVFDADTTEYVVTTSNATNTVTATAAEGLTVEILNGEMPVESGTAATWETGENELTITVSGEGYNPTTYTVTVTKE